MADQVQKYTQAAQEPGASPAGPQTTELVISGMTCASCARRVERALSRTPGVSEANVNLAMEHAQVTYDPASASLADLIHSVERAGYGASSPAPATTAGLIGPADSDSSALDAETVRRQLDLRRPRRTLALGVALSVPVVILSMFFLDSPGDGLACYPAAACERPHLRSGGDGPVLSDGGEQFAAAASLWAKRSGPHSCIGLRESTEKLTTFSISLTQYALPNP